MESAGAPLSGANMKPSSNSSIFAYSLILPVVWILGMIPLAAVLPSDIFGPAGSVIVKTALIAIIAALLICWAFVKRYDRSFRTKELLYMLTSCLGWAVLMESYSLWVHLLAAGKSWQQVTSPLVLQYLYVLGISVAIDALLIAVAFWRVGLPLIESYLNKRRL